jgi:hypothetical protein
MYFGPHATWLCANLICQCLVSLAVEDDPNRVSTKPVDHWFQQLGDQAFEEREQATRHLSTLGLSVKSKLLAGKRSTDPEIRWRCAKLWADVAEMDFQLRAEAFLRDPAGIDPHEFPGWDRYRTLFGTAPAARQTFLSMQKQEPALWEEAAAGAAPDPRLFRDRCRQLRTIAQNDQGLQRILGSTALALVYLGSSYETLVSDEDRELITALWQHSAVVDCTLSNTAWSSIKARWLRGGGDQRPAFERMMDGLGLADDGVVPIARELLRDPSAPAKQKQFALLALAKYGFSEDDDLIRTFLVDASPLETYLSRGVVLQTQLRDVALASLIARAGKAPADYGFQFVRPDDRGLFLPSTLGFKDDNERRAAFEKWRSPTAGRDEGIAHSVQ